ncbi:MAG: hypothetical protein HKO02_13065 [Hyphomonadaceae bacterium]|nr:hypothetical protein [Hyphomonadaceae bacterium]
MTNLGKLSKGLLCASALSLFMGGNAFAAPLNLTPAGTNVQNTFTLDYQVSGVDQPTIDTGTSGTNTPTEFTVDRLIDLTVDSTADSNVAPGATGETLEFSVTNTGNDTQAYDLSLFDPTTDTFEATSLSVLYYVDDGDGIFDPDTGSGGTDGVGVPYVPGTTGPTADIAADGILWVVVTGDIPGTATDGQTDAIVLVADTLEPTTGSTPGAPVVADTGGNTLTGAAENVLGDGSGTAPADAANAGDHSATGTFIIAAADVSASKSVTVFLEDGVDAATCGTIPGTGDTDPLSIPGSCVEYVISATNAGTASATATAISISDFLPEELIFAGAVTSGFGGTPAPTLSTPAVGTDCTITTAPQTTCEVTLTGAELAPGATGTVTIRALVE